MYVPYHENGEQTALGWLGMMLNASGRGSGVRSNDTTSGDFAREWTNPSVIIATILMLAGDSVIRAALAQTAGKWYTPVCFSFGWLSYSISTLVDVFGDGKLLPPPDYPVKVFNLTSGYCRENRNWIIGRIVRDHQTWISKKEPLNDNAIRIALCEAEHNRMGCLSVRWSKLHILGVITMTLQLLVASIPTILTNGQEWGVLLVTTIGTVLTITMGCLPQWTAEKLPRGNQSSPHTYILTAGNGSRDVMVIRGMGRCMNLEELAAHESPMNSRPWLKFDKSTSNHQLWTQKLSKEIWGYPKGFFITLCITMILAISWLLLFITIPAIQGHTWYFIMVAGLGWLNNAIIAGVRRKPKQRNLPLKYDQTIVARKVMDGLMDLEMMLAGCGDLLVREFLPGKLLQDEIDWWSEEPSRRRNTKYDQTRMRESNLRYTPESMGYVERDTFGAEDVSAEVTRHRRISQTVAPSHMKLAPKGSENQLVPTVGITPAPQAENRLSAPKAVADEPSGSARSLPNITSSHIDERTSSPTLGPRVVHNVSPLSSPKRTQFDRSLKMAGNFTTTPDWD